MRRKDPTRWPVTAVLAAALAAVLAPALAQGDPHGTVEVRYRNADRELGLSET